MIRIYLWEQIDETGIWFLGGLRQLMAYGRMKTSETNIGY